MQDLRELLAAIPPVRRNEAGVVVHDYSADEDQSNQIEAIRTFLGALLDRVEAPAQAPPVAAEAGVGEDGIPSAFRSLMMDGESAEKFTERMRRRWTALQQYRIDGTKPTASRALPDMTDEEKAELNDLEERNRRFRWLD
jgi:hypothetical protein